MAEKTKEYLEGEMNKLRDLAKTIADQTEHVAQLLQLTVQQWDRAAHMYSVLATLEQRINALARSSERCALISAADHTEEGLHGDD